MTWCSSIFPFAFRGGSLPPSFPIRYSYWPFLFVTLFSSLSTSCSLSSLSDVGRRPFSCSLRRHALIFLCCLPHALEVIQSAINKSTGEERRRRWGFRLLFWDPFSSPSVAQSKVWNAICQAKDFLNRDGAIHFKIQDEKVKRYDRKKCLE